MKTKHLLSTILFNTVFLAFVIAQPSESELKKKVYAYYEDASFIQEITFQKPKMEKRWVKTEWKYYWSRKFNIKGKTDYPGIYQLIYGGVQYEKNGSNYSYDRILTGGTFGYEGIPNPNKEEVNQQLKKSFDPLVFYGNYKMNYLIDAPNTIHLADDPNWKWIGLNEVKCNVISDYTVLTNNIGGVQDKRGVFRISLKRSEDGKTFDPEAGLLKSGKWLTVKKGDEIKTEILKTYSISKEELKNTKTFSQKYAERHAQEFQKSLSIIDVPDFENSNHAMQFIHEMLIDGDKEKITALCYKMFPKHLFEEWSDIVLNQNGKEMLKNILKDLDYYEEGFCIHPIIKEIGSTYVRFYDRNKKRMNRISVSYENDRWYLYEVKYFINEEDLTGFRENQETNCGENPIYLDEDPSFKKGDLVEIFEGGTWRDAEILNAEMNKGGYSVKYGISGLTTWKYVSEVRASQNQKSQESQEAQAFKNFDIGQKVMAKYTNVWYPGTILKVNYDKEEYLVEIPDRNIDAWINNQDIKNQENTSTKNNKQETTDSKKEKKEEKKKLNLGGLKNKVKIR